VPLFSTFCLVNSPPSPLSMSLCSSADDVSGDLPRFAFFQRLPPSRQTPRRSRFRYPTPLYASFAPLFESPFLPGRRPPSPPCSRNPFFLSLPGDPRGLPARNHRPLQGAAVPLLNTGNLVIIIPPGSIPQGLTPIPLPR